jgi:hypothetical protein
MLSSQDLNSIAAKVLCAFLVSRTIATCSTCHNFLDLTILPMLGGLHDSQKWPLWNILNCPLIVSDIFLHSLSSYICNLWIILKIRGHVSDAYKTGGKFFELLPWRDKISICCSKLVYFARIPCRNFISVVGILCVSILASDFLLSMSQLYIT